MGEAKRKQNLKDATRLLTPQYYAVMALVLHRELGFGQKRMVKLLSSVFDLFSEYEYKSRELFERCREETGITFVFDQPDTPDGESAKENNNEQKQATT